MQTPESSGVIRLGLLGASSIAPTAIIEPVSRRSDVSVRAVAARQIVRAESFASEHKIPHVAVDYAALLARDDIDLVYVSLPPSEHARWSIAALQAGKAVLCEKPLAISSDEVRAIYAEALASRRPVWEALHYQYHPAIRQARALCLQRAFGDVLHMEASFDAAIIRKPSEIRWRQELGGGSLMDLGCYAVHAARTLLGDPLTVETSAATFLDGVDARLSAALRSPTGVTARLSCSMIDAEFASSLTLHGTRGQLAIDGFVCPHWEGRVRLTVDGRTEQLPIDPRPTYDWQIDHVVQALQSGAQTSDTAADSLENMLLIEAILRSARRDSSGVSRA